MAGIALDDALGGFVVSGMLLVIGVLLMRRAFKRRKQRQLIAETPTAEVESLALGPTEVKGRAVPAEGAIRAPFSDAECLIAQWRVEQYYEDDDSSGWRTKSSGVECAPFYVDDGTGRVLVVPDDRTTYSIDSDAEPMFEVDARQRPPDPVVEFFGERNDFDPFGSLLSTLDLASTFDFRKEGGFTFSMGGHRRGDRRYYQNLVRPDEEVFVFGTVQTREGSRSARNPENLVIRRVPEGDEDLQPLFLIADNPEAKLLAERKWSLLWFPVGALLTTAGVGGVILVASSLLGVDVAVF